MKAIRNAALVIAFLATIAPIAHLMQLPWKLALNGPLWLSVQQHLSSVWSAFDSPMMFIALASSLALFLATRRESEHSKAYLAAAFCYLSMILYFFLFNDWVNQTVSNWTAATLPANWTEFRLKWETGQALAALFSVIAFLTLLHARFQEAAEARAR